MKIITLIFGLFIILTSCSPKPEPIEYGHDDCEYCKMTIMDPKFGAEVVTEKGKVYKFDAIECMLDYMYDDDFRKDKISLYLINTFNNPGELFDATGAYYLVSENLPSPMGQYLSGYEDKQSAVEMHNEKGGKIYDWKSINDVYRKRFELINP